MSSRPATSYRRCITTQEAETGKIQFLLASTGLVYGAQTPPFSEDMPPLPQDDYALSKYLAEQAVSAFGRAAASVPAFFGPRFCMDLDRLGHVHPRCDPVLATRAAFSDDRRCANPRFRVRGDMVEAIRLAVDRMLEGPSTWVLARISPCVTPVR